MKTSRQAYETTHQMYKNALVRRSKYQKILEDVALPLSAMQGLELYLPESMWAQKEQKTQNDEDAYENRRIEARDENFFITHVDGMQEEHADTFFHEPTAQDDSITDTLPPYESPLHATTPKVFQHQKHFQQSLNEQFQSGTTEGRAEDTIAATMDAVLGAASTTLHQSSAFSASHKRLPFYKYERAIQRITLPKVQHGNTGSSSNNTKRRRKRKHPTSRADSTLQLERTAPARSRPTEFLNPKNFRSLDQLERINDTRALGVREHMLKIARQRIRDEVQLQEQRRHLLLRQETHGPNEGIGVPVERDSHELQRHVKVHIGEDFTTPADRTPDASLFEELANTSRKDVIQRAMQTTKGLQGGRVERVQKRSLSPVAPATRGAIGSGSLPTSSQNGTSLQGKSRMEQLRELIPVDPSTLIPGLSLEQTIVV